LSADLQVKDSEDKVHYRIAGDLQSRNSDFTFSLRQDGLILNYEPWTMSTANEIYFGKSGIQAVDFVLSNNTQRLSLNTDPPALNNPVEIDFNNFKIETLT